MASIHLVKNVYYLSYRINSKQHKEKIGSVPKSIATECKRAKEIELARINAGIKLPVKKKITDFIPEYLAWVRNDQGKGTIKSKESTYRNLVLVLNELNCNIIYLNDINTQFIEKYKDYRLNNVLHKKKIKKRTVNIEFEVVGVVKTMDRIS